MTRNINKSVSKKRVYKGGNNVKYIIAKSVSEALTSLQQADGKALIIAGGTDLMIDLTEKKKEAETLVDISKIKELQSIDLEDGVLIIGAAVTLTEIACSPLVKQHLPSLAKGAKSVGALQIRNIGTLVGNVVTAQPAADGAMAIAPLNPIFVVEGANGTRQMAMSDMYAGFGKSVLDSSKEMATSIRIPCPDKGEAAAFMRLDQRSSLALPMLNVAAMAKVVEDKVVWARITMGPVGVGPTRASQAEKWLIGKQFNSENIEKASKLSLEDANPRSNPLRGSREYRMQTLPVLIKRALTDIATQLNINLSTSQESE